MVFNRLDEAHSEDIVQIVLRGTPEDLYEILIRYTHQVLGG